MRVNRENERGETDEGKAGRSKGMEEGDMNAFDGMVD